MTTTIDIHELPARLQEVIALATSGGEVTLTDGPVALARIVPIEPAEKRIAGLNAGSMVATEDFDSPLPDDFWNGRV